MTAYYDAELKWLSFGAFRILIEVKFFCYKIKSEEY